jgi:hypothetical protein
MTTKEDETENETTPTAPTTPVAEPAPPIDRLDAIEIELRSRYLITKQQLDAVGAEVASLVKMIRDEVIAQIDDLAATVGHHADTLDLHASTVAELATTVGRGAAPPPPTNRGDVGQRRLPGAPELDSASSALPNLELGAAPVDTIDHDAGTLTLDTKRPGQRTFPLKTGGELVVNVRRPAPPRAGGMLRDGRPTGGGTRRG